MAMATAVPAGAPPDGTVSQVAPPDPLALKYLSLVTGPADFTSVPSKSIYVPSIAVPCHEPVAIVPNVVTLVEPVQVLSAVFSTLSRLKSV